MLKRERSHPRAIEPGASKPRSNAQAPALGTKHAAAHARPAHAHARARYALRILLAHTLLDSHMATADTRASLKSLDALR